MSRNLLESWRILQISVDRFICNPCRSVGGLHPVHLVIRGDYELVQGVAIDAECRRPDAYPDTRRTVSSERQRELRHRTLDAHAQIFYLRSDNLLHECDKLIAT